LQRWGAPIRNVGKKKSLGKSFGGRGEKTSIERKLKKNSFPKVSEGQ